MKNLFSIILIGLALMACEPEERFKKDEPEIPAEEMVFAESEMMDKRSIRANFTSQPNQQDAKIIKNGSLQIKVKDLDLFLSSIRPILVSHEAYTTNESQNTFDRRAELNLTIRVPDGSFESLFNEFGKLGNVESQSINQRDVTEEFIDVESRLKNRKALEIRYRELLKQARNVNDILNIERQLNNVRSEIEAQEGRLKYLSNQVDFSTIQLTAFVNKPFVYEPGEQDSFGQRLLDSLANGWHGLVSGILWIFRVWPFWLLVFLGFIYWKRRN